MRKLEKSSICNTRWGEANDVVRLTPTRIVEPENFIPRKQRRTGNVLLILLLYSIAKVPVTQL